MSFCAWQGKEKNHRRKVSQQHHHKEYCPGKPELNRRSRELVKKMNGGRGRNLNQMLAEVRDKTRINTLPGRPPRGHNSISRLVPRGRGGVGHANERNPFHLPCNHANNKCSLYSSQSHYYVSGVNTPCHGICRYHGMLPVISDHYLFLGLRARISEKQSAV